MKPKDFRGFTQMVGRRLLLGFLITGAGLLGIVPGLYGSQPVSDAAPQNAATPTVDRLAAPPTVASPSQADLGAQVYWLYCQPCHGDRGQGLTDEWRAQYPPEDRNCWNSGCHGRSPYANGFKLPEHVPALIGPETLTRFDTAQSLHAYISARMPFQAPDSLADDEYWQLTAYLLRSNGVSWSGALDAVLAARLYLRPPSPAPTPTPRPGGIKVLAFDSGGWVWWLAAGVIACTSLGVLLWRRRRRG